MNNIPWKSNHSFRTTIILVPVHHHPKRTMVDFGISTSTFQGVTTWPWGMVNWQVCNATIWAPKPEGPGKFTSLSSLVFLRYIHYFRILWMWECKKDTKHVGDGFCINSILVISNKFWILGISTVPKTNMKPKNHSFKRKLIFSTLCNTFIDSCQVSFRRGFWPMSCIISGLLCPKPWLSEQ